MLKILIYKTLETIFLCWNYIDPPFNIIYLKLLALPLILKKMLQLLVWLIGLSSPHAPQEDKFSLVTMSIIVYVLNSGLSTYPHDFIMDASYMHCHILNSSSICRLCSVLNADKCQWWSFCFIHWNKNSWCRSDELNLVRFQAQVFGELNNAA